MGILKKLFPSRNDKEVKKLKKTADIIESLSEEFKAKSNDELREYTNILKERFNNGASLDDLLPESFALVREASERVLGMRHFYVQLLGGIVLHQGRIAEMRTGEGKTLVATLPAYLNALSGKSVHIVTVNDYLAKRDAEWMGKVHKFLGMSVGVIVPEMKDEDKKLNYSCDIVYATNNELGFDYLRDNMALNKDDKRQRDLNFAIIDEVDSILIDEARTPLIISTSGQKASDLYRITNNFAVALRENDIIVEEKEKTCRLSEIGVAKAESFFKVDNISDIENQQINHHINNALKAHFIMKKESSYIVDEGEVIIVDEFTGRKMEGRRFSDGLHQAIEAKEKIKVRGESRTLATITFQNFFRLYTKLSGMTGTAKTEEAEFRDIYALDVLELPTNMPINRSDSNDQLYTTVAGKHRAMVNDIKKAYEKGQPVLVGTVTVEKSEELSRMLQRERIRHNVLNAKNHKQEAEIIAQAGKFGAVTIATNMAGRGTDIVLGGNPEYLAKEKMLKLGYKPEMIEAILSFAPTEDAEIIKGKEDFKKYFDLFKIDTEEEKRKVIEAGGLRIIGTERHDSRRIDNQLRGRAGRQGDIGSSVFYLSLEDDIARIFGGDTIKSIAERMNFDVDTPINAGVVSRSIERAQRRVEDRDFTTRKHVLYYDDIMNSQRRIMYTERDKVLGEADIHEQVISMIAEVANSLCDKYIDIDKGYMDWDYEEFNKALERKLIKEDTALITPELCKDRNIEKIRNAIVDCTLEQLDEKREMFKEMGEDFSNFERYIMLRIVDAKWMEHIDEMDKLKQSVSLLAYGQKDPRVAYRQYSYEMFNEMTEAIHEQTATYLCKTEVARKERVKTQEEKKLFTVVKERETGRNSPCPCGSGKKFKQCCLGKDKKN